MTKKESAAQPEPSQIKPEAPKSIEEIILDYQKDKYMAVPLASSGPLSCSGGKRTGIGHSPRSPRWPCAMF